MTDERQFYELMQSSDPRDQVIVRLVGSLGSHPGFAIMTASLIYELHGPNWAAWREAEARRGVAVPEPIWR